MAFGFNKLLIPPMVANHRGPETPPGTTSFERKLDTVSSSRSIDGNQVTILQDGAEFYPALVADLKAATSFIYFENFIISADEIGNAIADLLIDKARAGLKVALIYDALGCFHTPESYWQRLRAAGILVRKFHPFGPKFIYHRNRDHRKVVVIDNLVGYTGGLCISDEWFIGVPLKRGPWRDTGIRLTGPIVAQLRSAFAETWLAAHDDQSRNLKDALAPLALIDPEVLTGTIPVRVFRSDANKDHLELYHTYLFALVACRKTAYLANAYFVPDRRWRKVLIEAVKRGVDVRILLPGRNNHFSVKYASHYYYEELLAEGVRIYEYDPVMLHAKTAVFDGVWSLLGSCNLDYLSLLHNFELNVGIRDQDIAAQLQERFHQDLTQATELKIAEWRLRGLPERFLENFFVLWRPEL